jgi:hypothetical protein
MHFWGGLCPEMVYMDINSNPAEWVFPPGKMFRFLYTRRDTK